MAEALLRHTDSSHFEAHSAGLEAGEIDSRTLESLDHIGVDTTGLHSKTFDEFDGQPLHHVITL
jgi:protein-tyrosine-phosphatase